MFLIIFGVFMMDSVSAVAGTVQLQCVCVLTALFMFTHIVTINIIFSLHV